MFHSVISSERFELKEKFQTWAVARTDWAQEHFFFFFFFAETEDELSSPWNIPHWAKCCALDVVTETVTGTAGISHYTTTKKRRHFYKWTKAKSADFLYSVGSHGSKQYLVVQEILFCYRTSVTLTIYTQDGTNPFWANLQPTLYSMLANLFLKIDFLPP
jgi:hypothetical protein